MRTRNLFAALAAAALAATAYAHSDPKPWPVEVENPGFEAGKAGWSVPANGAIDASVAHGGAASASLTVADPDRDGVYIARNIPVEAGTAYRASVFVKTEGVKPAGKRDSVGAGLIVEWSGKDGRWLSAAGGAYACEVFGTRDWTRVTCESLLAPDGAAYASVCLALRGEGKAWFDDFALEKMAVAVEAKEPAADATLACNTPLLSWEGLKNTDTVTVEVSQDKTFPAGATRVHEVTGATSLQLKEPLEPGVWFWRVRALGAVDSETRAFTQTAPKSRDCLPPEIRTAARRVLASDETFAVTVQEAGRKPPRVTFGGVKGKCGARDRDGVCTVTFRPPEGGWAPGLTEGEIVATDAAGNRATRPFWLLNCPKPANDVAVDAAGDFVQAGKRIFPLGIYEVQPKDFREVRDAGFDVVHSYKWESSQDDAACRAYLDACWATDGLRAFIGFDRGKWSKKGIIQNNVSHIAHRVAALADHPGLFCWYLFDEPQHAHQYIPPTRLAAMADFIRALDPHHAVVVSTGGEYDYRRSWDTHWTQAYEDPAGVVREIDRQRRALKDDSPVTALVNCNDGPQTMAMRRTGAKPDPAKFERDYDYLRACAFLGVVKRCNGVFWWWFARDATDYYSASQCPAAWANLVKVVKELGALRPLVTAPGPVETGTAVDGDCKVEWWRKDVKGRKVLIAVNTGTGPATVTVGGRKLSFRRYEVKVEK